MRDPERLFSSNGITDFERELIGAAKNEPVPDALREQMERALGLPGGVGAGAGASRMAHAQGVVGVKAATVVWVSAGVIALGFVGGILGARFVGRGAPAPYTASTTAAPAATAEVPGSIVIPVRRPSSISSAPASASARAPAPAQASVSPSAPLSKSPPSKSSALVVSPARPMAVEDASVRAPVVAALPPASSVGSPSSAEVARSAARPRVVATRELKHVRATTPTTPPATRRDPPPATDDLRGEIDLIDAARGALRTGTATRALELLGRYAARFPHGSLAPEGTALRVEALMRVGRSVEARAIARRFVAANPTSPLVERMNSLAH